jgi:hypothetical protein
MDFVRGESPMEALGLGEFTPIIKDIKNYVQAALVEGKTLWYYPDATTKWDLSKMKVEFKTIQDKPSGNCHKFIFIVSGAPLGEMKEVVVLNSIKNKFFQNGCKVASMSFFHTEKHFKKYGFEHGQNKLLVEIVYAKLKKK